ncbi:MAG: hypothetical protein ACJAUP_001316 [Cellvibrionaceae bacterium]|jgi:hypothetical protein
MVNGPSSSRLEPEQNRADRPENRSVETTSLAHKDIRESKFNSKVRFGGEVIDLKEAREAISQDTFKSLMDEEPDKPFFAFAHVHSGSTHHEFKHLYSAENVVNWYPLAGKTDPCNNRKIDKIEYYLHMKGQPDAIHMGDIYQNENKNVSKTADYLIWSLTAEDEPSKMMHLLATAYLQNFGITNISSNDTFDTSDILHLNLQKVRSPEQERTDKLNANKIYSYIGTHVATLIKQGKLNCSDPDALLLSIKHDAAVHLAGVLVSLDPNINDDNDDYAKLPHVRTNAVAEAIQQSCAFDGFGVEEPSIASSDLTPVSRGLDKVRSRPVLTSTRTF